MSAPDRIKRRAARRMFWRDVLMNRRDILLSAPPGGMRAGGALRFARVAAQTEAIAAAWGSNHAGLREVKEKYDTGLFIVHHGFVRRAAQ